MSVSAAVSDLALTVRDKLKGKVSQVKVKRYWPGKAPEWAEEHEETDEKVSETRENVSQSEPLFRNQKEDARLRRLEESRRDRDEAVFHHRQIRHAEIVSTREAEIPADKAGKENEPSEDQSDEDESAIEERRRRIRERLLEAERAREVLDPEGEAGVDDEEEEEEDDDEESEYETESDEEGNIITLSKPLFVPKAERDTIAEKERIEKEETELGNALKLRLDERKAETKLLVVEEIRKEVEMEKAQTEGNPLGSDVDTDDDTNEAEEYESWKAREILRIKRDKEDRESATKEREKLDKLRNMTEEERREWERANPKVVDKVPKKKWKFMQKYYHKGAFFQTNPDDTRGTSGADEIFRRDFSDPTGEDRVDKSILPKVMQVKQFGRSGRTKWTHLVNEDTTQWDTPWAVNDDLRAKYNAKMAGMNRPIEKPRGSKKIKDNMEL